MADQPLAPVELHEVGPTYLDPATLEFATTPGGFLRLTLPDRCWRRVTVYRALPLSHPDEYLSLRSGEDEVGVLRNLNDLAPEQRALVQAEIGRRYFTPKIIEVRRVKGLGGSYDWDVETDRGPVKFATKHPRHSVVKIGDDRYLVTDSNNNRYEIPSVLSLDRRSRALMITLLG